MKRFREIIDQKEHLSRELAEACRDYIDLKFKYQEVVGSYRIVKDVLANKLVDSQEAASIEDAFLQINQHVELELTKASQLNLPLTGENSNDR